MLCTIIWMAIEVSEYLLNGNILITLCMRPGLLTYSQVTNEYPVDDKAYI